MKEKVLSMLTALTLLLSLCVPAFAAEDTGATLGGATTQDWYYNAARWAIGSDVAESGDKTGNTLPAADWAKMLRTVYGRTDIPEESGMLLRAGAVSSLYSLFGSGEKAVAAPFADVPEDDANYDAVLWARAKGITNGTDENLFAPSEALTLGQAVTMLYRWRMAQDGFVEIETPVFRKALTAETVALRFYADAPNVPYIGVGRFYSLMLPGKTLRIEKTGESAYTLTNDNGSASADTAAETFSSDNYVAFTNQMELVQQGAPNVYLDGYGFARVDHNEYDKDPARVTLRFADYGIDLRGDDAEVYFPFQTLADMFSEIGYHYAAYNGVNVYVNEDNQLPTMYNRDEHYYDSILSMTYRPADLASFGYREMCFAIDHFFGMPGATTLERKCDLAGVGLDKALERYGESGLLTRKQLCSTDMSQYQLGLSRLSLLLYDKGHTLIEPFVLNKSINARYKEDTSILNDLVPDYQETDRMKTGSNTTALMETRTPIYDPDMKIEDSYYKGTTYIKYKDTVICVFNSFMKEDYDEWQAFYAGTGKRPTGETSGLMSVIEALERAQADPEVKNFIIDITLNGGGSADVVAALTSLLVNDSRIRMKNILTGQTVTTYYEIDRNFDGKFDEKDAEVSYDGLNVAVLTSGYSFSCANLFPSIMKEHGVLLLGHRSGGGTCAIQMMSDACGYSFQISSYMGHLVNDAGESIDSGIPVDVELLKYDDDGKEDYSGFYDFDAMREAMNTFYAQKPAA